MNFESLKNQLPDFAKDIKLNLSSVLSTDGAPDLSAKQILLVALASAYATKRSDIVNALQSIAEEPFTDTELNAAKASASIMAMNNIYYRFLHMVEDKSFMSLPAKLRMNVIANPGIDKNDFELCCLAVSALNGCGMCVEAHTNALLKAGTSKLAVQSCVRIAAVINAFGLSLTIS